MKFFEDTIRWEAHRGFVARQIFCSYCGSIMDCRRSVSLDLYSSQRSLLMSKILCLNCFKNIDLKVAAGTLGLMSLEIYNGKTKQFTVIKGELA